MYFIIVNVLNIKSHVIQNYLVALDKKNFSIASTSSCKASHMSSDLGTKVA